MLGFGALISVDKNPDLSFVYFGNDWFAENRILDFASRCALP